MLIPYSLGHMVWYTLIAALSCFVRPLSNWNSRKLPSLEFCFCNPDQSSAVSDADLSYVSSTLGACYRRLLLLFKVGPLLFRQCLS